MTRLLGILVLLVVGVVALGLYQGWFTVTSDNADDKTNINIKVDKKKMQEDEKKAEQKAQELGHKAKDKIDAAGQKIEEKTAHPPKQ
ncbi:MAG: hypothetical protein ACJ8FY_27470 [Gemmataceae bacterium]